MDLAVSGALSKQKIAKRQSLFSRRSSGPPIEPEDYDSEGFRKLRYRQFTKRSFERLLIKEAEEKHEEAERKLRSQEAHLIDGELKFGMDFFEGLRPDRNPDLEEGQILRSNYGIPPLHLLGVPLEEVDEGVSGKTFVVMARRLHRIYISRFSATPSFVIIPVWNPIRKWAVLIYTHQIFDFLILFTIVVNCILLAFPEEQINSSTEVVFLLIYFLEMLTKMVARGLFAAKYTYLRDPWNWLDLLVVISGIPNLISPSFNSGKSAAATHGSTSAAVQALRSFRVLRAVKTISIFPGLKTIVTAILRAMRMLGEVVLLTTFCLCVFSLLSVHFYEGTLRQKCVRNPQTLLHFKKSYENYDYFYHRVTLDRENWDITSDGEYMLCGNATGAGGCRENYICLPNIGENPNFGFTNFDNILHSMMITFQLMTIDFWENAFRKVLWTNGILTVFFFIILVFFGSFYLLNLMLAVVNITYQEEAQRTLKELEKERASRAKKQKAKNKFYKLMKKHGAFTALLKINLEKHRMEKKLKNIVTHWQIATYVSKKLQSDPDCIYFLKPFVRKGRDVRDVFENVAYSFKRWQSLYRQHKNEEAAVRKLSTSVDKDITNAGKSFSGAHVSKLEALLSLEQPKAVSVLKSTSGKISSQTDDLQQVNTAVGATADHEKAWKEKEVTLSLNESNKTVTLSPKESDRDVRSSGTPKSVTIEDPKPLPLSAKDKVLSHVISNSSMLRKTSISEQPAEWQQFPQSAQLSQLGIPQAPYIRRHTIADVCDFPVLGAVSCLYLRAKFNCQDLLV